MAEKNERFEVVYKEGSSIKDGGMKQLLVDRETGVTYLFVRSGYAAGITPLLNADGTPVITKP